MTQLTAAPEIFSKVAGSQMHLPSSGSSLQVLAEAAASWRHLWEHTGMKGLMSWAATRAAEAARMKVEVFIFAVVCCGCCRNQKRRERESLCVCKAGSTNERTTVASV